MYTIIMMQMPQVRKVYPDVAKMINKPHLLRKGLKRPMFV